MGKPFSSALDIAQMATQPTPATGRALLYPKADDRLYGMDDAGNEYRLDNTSIQAFTYAGALTVKVGTSRLPILFPCVIEAVSAMIGTAPTGASVLIDVNKNGTTIFGTQANRPTIAAAANLATLAGGWSTLTLAANDYLSVDVDQIGSTVAGSDLVVTVALRRTG